MLAWMPHAEVAQFEAAGTANVHHVRNGRGGLPSATDPARSPGLGRPVSMPSEKLEPVVPGSLTAVPDWRGTAELSHAETVNEWRVSITGAMALACAPPPRIASELPG